MAAQSDRGVPFSTLCPKFLHTNSTSHTWPFSAIAELIDNAYDPDVSANHFWIDKTVFQEQDCLIFMDSGNGLDIETMHKMLSFGYSDKTALKGVKPIGMYGNGFKSGAMRLGKDAIVFSKSKTTSCVGMLSQTYLKEIDAKQIVVPIVCFEEIQTNKFSVREEQQASLNDILTYSPFKTQDELLKEIKIISSSFSDSKTGTRIIIWNLRRTPTRTSEFDFWTDRYDIRIPSDVYEEMDESGQQLGRLPSHIPESFYSLRAYCSILYLKPRMQIIIRGQKVKSQLIAKSLAFVRKDVYKPTFLNNKPIPITFGYNTKSKDQYGVMMYHKNRLIKAYERVGCQLKANNKGVGVIGVIECGKFLEPTHNKQSFNETDQYRKTMTNLGIKLEEYWQEMRYRRQTEYPNNSIPLEDTTKRPDQSWAQCDKCLTWRKLPDGIDPSKLPNKWFCHLNPDPAFRSCEVPEEREDSDDDQPAYRKTYKQQERVLKQKEEMKRKTAEQQKLAQLKRQEDNCLAELAKQNQALKRQLQIRERIANSPSNNTNAKSANIASPQGGAATAKSSLLRTSTVSQAACSSAGSSGLPVISSVCSLSTTVLGQKRTQLTPPQTTPKRPRFSGLHTGPSNTSTSEDVGPQSSPSVSLNGDDDDEDDETDDDIFILETSSTPKPKKPELDLTKVKTEQVQSDVDVLLECSDDAALDVSMETNDAAANAVGASPFPVHASSTTQTEVTKLKKEDESPSVSEGEERAVQSTADLKDKEKCEDEDVGVCRTKTDCMDDEVAGPSCSGAYDKNPSVTTYPGMVEVQKQQDQLLELMQSTAEERDSLKDEVHRLTCELHDMQSKLQELTQINVKKECSHQASQTEETGEGGCYKSLFEKAKQKVDELIKDKEGLLLATESKPSTSKEEEKDMDEIALQVDSLLRELDERNNERDELRTQLDHLEEERANMASQCEELRLSLQQQKEDRGASHGTTNSSVRTHPEDNGGTSSGPDASKSSLIELRHNIGRLLVSIVPALDLGQVNYECNVIDEILEQVLCNPGTTEPVELNFRSKSINTSS